jgi:hypothetical protein
LPERKAYGTPRRFSSPSQYAILFSKRLHVPL